MVTACCLRSEDNALIAGTARSQESDLAAPARQWMLTLQNAEGSHVAPQDGASSSPLFLSPRCRTKRPGKSVRPARSFCSFGAESACHNTSGTLGLSAITLVASMSSTSGTDL